MLWCVKGRCMCVWGWVWVDKSRGSTLVFFHFLLLLEFCVCVCVFVKREREKSRHGSFNGRRWHHRKKCWRQPLVFWLGFECSRTGVRKMRPGLITSAFDSWDGGGDQFGLVGLFSRDDGRAQQQADGSATAGIQNPPYTPKSIEQIYISTLIVIVVSSG